MPLNWWKQDKMWGNMCVCVLVGTGYYFGIQTYVAHVVGLSGRWIHFRFVFASTFLFWVLSCFSCYWVYFRTETYVRYKPVLSRRWITSYLAVGLCWERLQPNWPCRPTHFWSTWGFKLWRGRSPDLSLASGDWRGRMRASAGAKAGCSMW